MVNRIWKQSADGKSQKQSQALRNELWLNRIRKIQQRLRLSHHSRWIRHSHQTQPFATHMLLGTQSQNKPDLDGSSQTMNRPLSRHSSWLHQNLASFRLTCAHQSHRFDHKTEGSPRNSIGYWNSIVVFHILLFLFHSKEAKWASKSGCKTLTNLQIWTQLKSALVF